MFREMEYDDLKCDSMTKLTGFAADKYKVS